MDKNETSHMREKYWNGKPRKLAPGAAAFPYDPSVSLKNPKFIRDAILQSLSEGDFAAVIDIYRAHLRVLNRTQTAKLLNVSRQYVHKMLKPTSSPSLRIFAGFMKVLGKEIEALNKA